jgi:hypothetical protein
VDAVLLCDGTVIPRLESRITIPGPSGCRRASETILHRIATTGIDQDLIVVPRLEDAVFARPVGLTWKIVHRHADATTTPQPSGAALGLAPQQS